MDLTGQNIADAIKLLSIENQTAYDKTIVATYVRIKDVESGKHIVNYQGTDITVSADSNLKLREGQNVRVLIPESNLSYAFILGGTSYDNKDNTSSDYINILNKQYYKVGQDFSEWFSYDSSISFPLGIMAGKTTTSSGGIYRERIIYTDNSNINISYYGVTPPTSPSAGSYWLDTSDVNKTVLKQYSGGNWVIVSDLINPIFTQYKNNYDYIKISAKFKTSIINSFSQKGNYGISITFKDITGGTNTYKLDINNFNGTPYNFIDYIEQQVVYTIPIKKLYKVTEIKFFQEGFVYESGSSIINANDIFVDALQINFVAKEQRNADTYYLYIDSPDGLYFNSTVAINYIHLKPQLIYNEESIFNGQNSVVHWYKEDRSIDTSSSAYDVSAGIGWKEIGNSDAESVELDKNNINYGTLTIPNTCVNTLNNYKLIVTYNNTITLDKEVTVTQLAGSYSNLHIVKNDTKLCLYDGDTQITSLVGNWYVLLENGTYTKLNPSPVYEQDIEPYLVYNLPIFYCEAQQNSNYIATLSYTLLPIIDVDVDVNTIRARFEGQDLYKYNADGQITVDERDKTRTLKISFFWDTAEITDSIVSVEWKLNSIVLPGSGFPSYCMMQSFVAGDIQSDNTATLSYKIKKQYGSINYEHLITVTALTASGKQLIFSKIINFIKDGGVGTNGTQYASLIKPMNGSSEINGLVICQVDSSGSIISHTNSSPYSTSSFKMEVYKRNELDSGWSFKWEVEKDNDNNNIITLSSDSSQVVSITNIRTNYSGDNDKNKYYLKCTASKTGEASLVSFYPLKVLFTGGSSYLSYDLNIQMPNYILYAADGTNPEYLNEPLVFIYDNSALSLTYGPTLSSYTIDENIYLQPKTYINWENGMGWISTTVNGKLLVCEIITTLNTYGNTNINEWDGTKVKVSDGYILTPQVAAGNKNNNNIFTGVIMGKNSNGNNGIFGYGTNGVGTFALNSDGTAYFGNNANGRIEIAADGKTTIKGVPTGSDIYSMTLKLLGNSSSDKAISIGNIASPTFYVTYDGKLNASEATISGTITAGNGGRIGDWYITNGRLANANSSIYLDADGTIHGTTIEGGTVDGATISGGSISIGNTFKVNSSGTLNASNATISGTITAGNGGRIGNWYITNGRLANASSSPTIYLDADGTIHGVKIESDNLKIYPANTTSGYVHKALSVYGSFGSIGDGQLYEALGIILDGYDIPGSACIVGGQDLYSWNNLWLGKAHYTLGYEGLDFIGIGNIDGTTDIKFYGTVDFTDAEVIGGNTATFG